MNILPSHAAEDKIRGAGNSNGYDMTIFPSTPKQRCGGCRSEVEMWQVKLFLLLLLRTKLTTSGQTEESGGKKDDLDVSEW